MLLHKLHLCIADQELFPVDSRSSRHYNEPKPAICYVAPQIELVLTASEIEREVLYAGSYTGQNPWTNIPD